MDVLIKKASFRTLDEEYIFYSLKKGTYRDIEKFQAKAFIFEVEGLSLIIEKKVADKFGLEYSSVFGCIVAEIHSSLEAVGFTAYISDKLLSKSISANVVAGYYHDYIFVPKKDIKKAYDTLYKID